MAVRITFCLNKLLKSYKLNIINARFMSVLNNTTDDLSIVSNIKDESTLSLPLITKRELTHTHMVNFDITPPREVWVQSLTSNIKLGIIQLHPIVFASFPKCDVIAKNVIWQRNYRKISRLTLKTRAEMPGGSRKPWPQKGTGRARQGSVRAPHWVNGGWCHGPRGPKSFFFMLPLDQRVYGLTSVLSAKLAQNDLKIVDTFDNFPSDEPDYLEKFCQERGWGPSVLFVDKNDFFPQNLALAAESIKYINLMPVYGLNVLSMLKHETLVLTLAAVDEIEEKILYQFSRTDLIEANRKISPQNLKLF